jgi:hypothetical protein
MYLFLFFLNISFEKIKYKKIVNIQKIKLGILAEKSLTQKIEKLIFCEIVNKYCDKYKLPFGSFGTKLFRYEK